MARNDESVTPGSMAGRIDLNGSWRVATADGDNRLRFHAIDFDDSDWDTIEVPGVWQSHARFRDEPGPMLFRRWIPMPAKSDPSQRWWLELDNVYYSADVWLNGQLLGSPVGYFMTHRYDITDLLTERDGEGMVAIDISAPSASPEETTNTLTGIYTDPDVMGATWNAGGIWRGVSLVPSGSVRIDRLRALCLSAAPDLATVRITALLDAGSAGPVTVTTRLAEHQSGLTALAATHHHQLATGSNELHWDVEITNPNLWWPASLGDQPLYDLIVTVTDERSAPGAASDTVTKRIGLRSVSTDRFVTTINGVRRFLKGATVWPLDVDPSATTRDAARACLHHAHSLGLDLLRVHAHVASPDLYAAADELGVLLWQDLPLRGPTTRAIEPQARRHARALVDQLGHHPSIITWCAHDDPSGTVTNPSDSPVSAGLQMARRYLPGWNTASLDRTLAHTLRSLDPTRQVLANSGLPPGAASPTDNDTVAWFGWRKGTGRDLAAFMRRHPRRVQWLSTFGAQSFPNNDAFVEPDRWPDLHWGELAGAYGLDLDALDRYVPRADYSDYASYRRATQDYQAALVRRQIEALRRTKYAPTGGFTFWTLLDTRPSVSFAVVDSDGNPKTAYAAITEACRPVIVVSDRLEPDLSPGDPVALAIDVVNDHLFGWKRAMVAATVSWTGGQHTYRFVQPIAPDAVTRMGILSWVAPDAPGPVRLMLTLENPDNADPLATNAYASRIVAHR